MSKANIFATHPAGFRIHVEIDDSRIPDVDERGDPMTSAGVINKMLSNLAILTKWMVDNHYEAEYAPAASTSATEASTQNPPCGQCGGPTEYKEGYSKKNGKQWKGWFCLKTKDAPQNAKHPPIWVDG